MPLAYSNSNPVQRVLSSFIHQSSLVPFLRFPFPLSLSLSLFIHKILFPFIHPFFAFLVSLFSSPFLQFTGSYFVHTTSSIFPQNHLTYPHFSYSPLLPFVSVSPTVQIAFRSQQYTCSHHLYANRRYVPSPIFYAKWSLYLLVQKKKKKNYKHCKRR